MKSSFSEIDNEFTSKTVILTSWNLLEQAFYIFRQVYKIYVKIQV